MWVNLWFGSRPPIDPAQNSSSSSNLCSSSFGPPVEKDKAPSFASSDEQELTAMSETKPLIAGSTEDAAEQFRRLKAYQPYVQFARRR
jgi:hypothetical protein